MCGNFLPRKPGTEICCRRERKEGFGFLLELDFDAEEKRRTTRERERVCDVECESGFSLPFYFTLEGSGSAVSAIRRQFKGRASGSAPL